MTDRHIAETRDRDKRMSDSYSYNDEMPIYLLHDTNEMNSIWYTQLLLCIHSLRAVICRKSRNHTPLHLPILLCNRWRQKSYRYLRGVSGKQARDREVVGRNHVANVCMHEILISKTKMQFDFPIVHQQTHGMNSLPLQVSQARTTKHIAH
jgi:hypothetical protein